MYKKAWCTWVQSCCFANQTFCFCDVLAIGVVFMQSRETQITMLKWTNAGGQTKRTNTTLQKQWSSSKFLQLTERSPYIFVTVTVSVIAPFKINIKVLFWTFGYFSKKKRPVPNKRPVLNNRPPLRYQKLISVPDTKSNHYGIWLKGREFYSLPL